MPVRETHPWFVRGRDFPEVYHGGRRKVRDLDPKELQKRDPGFYGRGFYVSTSRAYARTYNPVISTYRFRADASILEIPLAPWEAPEDLISAIQDAYRARHDKAARKRGKEESLEWEAGQIRSSAITWSKAVTEYGEDHDVDAISFGGGEIVIKDPESLEFVE